MLALLTVTSHLSLRDHPVGSHAAIAYFLFICAGPYWMLYVSLAASFGTKLNVSDHVIVANRRNDGLCDVLGRTNAISCWSTGIYRSGDCVGHHPCPLPATHPSGSCGRVERYLASLMSGCGAPVMPFLLQMIG
jgi:hypothetical protein